MTNQNNREELGMFDQSSMHHLGANLRRCIKRNNNQRLLRNRSSILDVSITHSLDFAVLVLISLTPAVIAAPVLSDCQAQSREFSDYPKGVSLWKTELLNKRIRSSPLSFPIAFGSHIPDILASRVVSVGFSIRRAIARLKEMKSFNAGILFAVPRVSQPLARKSSSIRI